MKRPIKFRGKRLDNGEFVYGDFVHRVPMSTFPGIIDDEDFIHEVKPDSVAQLVGYDTDVNEVYEGDTVVKDFHGTPYEYQARLGLLIKNIRNGVISYDLDQTTLKQEEQS